MSAVNEWIVREYFESLGFLVRQPTKYQVIARGKRPEEEIDLIVRNPAPTEPPPAPGLWTSRELRGVRQAVVAVFGWHTERISTATLDLSPEISRIGQPDVAAAAEHWLGPGPVTRILCVSALAPAAPMRAAVLRRLREAGIDGVLTFRTILCELVTFLDRNANYEKSDLLQILRILKTHGLLRDAQLELSLRRPNRRRGRAPRDASAATPDAASPTDA